MYRWTSLKNEPCVGLLKYEARCCLCCSDGTVSDEVLFCHITVLWRTSSKLIVMELGVRGPEGCDRGGQGARSQAGRFKNSNRVQVTERSVKSPVAMATSCQRSISPSPFNPYRTGVNRCVCVCVMNQPRTQWHAWRGRDCWETPADERISIRLLK